MNPTTTTPGLSLAITSDAMSVETDAVTGEQYGLLGINTEPGQLVTSTLALDVSTTGAAGYKLYATTSGTDKQGNYTNALVNKDIPTSTGAGAKIEALASSTTKTAFPAGRWGFSTDSLVGGEVVDNATFKAFPTYDIADGLAHGGTEIAGSNTAVADEDVAGETPLTIGIKADSELPAGNYTNSILFTIVANPITINYSLLFSGNTDGVGGEGDETLANMPEAASVGTADVYQAFVVPSDIPTRDGYAFIGWAESPDAVVASHVAGDEVTLQVSDINVSQTVSKTLYAIWEELPDDTKYLQNFNDAIDLRTVGDSDIYVDKRDGTEYTVKRLPDGKVWMTQNLRYMGTETAPGSDPIASGSWTTAEGSQTPGVAITNSLSAIYSTSETGAYYNGNTSYGAHYDWTAAHAVCPAGWHLPSVSEISTLDKAYGYVGRNRDSRGNDHGSVQQSYAAIEAQIANYTSTSGNWPGLVPNGEVYRGELAYSGGVALYWLSDGDGYNSDSLFHYNRSSASVRLIYTNYNDFYIKTYGDIGAGVRCVGDQPNSFYLQDFDESKMLPNTGDSATLTDKRDDATYTVKRLADGKVWMTQNLRYMGTSSDPGTASITSGSFTTTTELSQGNSTVGIVSSFTAVAGNKQARYNGNTTYGAYYTWEAALNVCPAGWHLADKNEFATLYTYYNTAAKLTSADGPYFVRAGDYVGGGATLKETSNVYVFSATETDSTRAETFAITSTNVVYATYANQYKYSASSARCIADDYAKVTFDANGGEGTMAVQSFTRGTAQVIAANQFTRAGYDFAGWATAPEAAVRYADRELARFSVATTLYAVWKPNYLQDFDAKTELREIGDAATLVDKRDGKTYTVERLADGRVWMTQNLAITGRVLDSNDTNLASGATFDMTSLSQSGSSGWCKTNSAACADKKAAYVDDIRGGYYNWYTATAGNGAYNTTASTTISYDICPKGWHLPVGNDAANRYNQFAALDEALGGTGVNRNSANTYTQMADIFSNDGFIYGSLDYVDTRGYYWTSTSHSSNVFNAGMFYMGADSNGVNPRSWDYKIDGHSIRCIASEEATVSFNANGGAGTMADVTVERGEGVTITNSFTKVAYDFLGFATSEDATAAEYEVGDIIYPTEDMVLYAVWEPKGEFMQDFDQNTELLLIGSSATLYDLRDGSDYTVKRLPDGKVWMTQNLRYAEGAYKVSSNESYGAFYNWTAAQNVCPAGWRLPVGGDDGEYVSLDKAYGYTGAWRRDQGADTLAQINNYKRTDENWPGIVLSGYYYNGSVYREGYSTLLWTSTRNASSQPSAFHINSSLPDNLIYPSYFFTDNGANNALVRCIADYDELMVSFDANGGTGTVPSSMTVVAGQEITLPASTLKRDGYRFLGWNTDSAATTATYEDGEAIAVTDDLELYAVWAVDYCTEDSPLTVGHSCVMADNNVWTYGNNGNRATWNSVCSGATGGSMHQATCASVCPAGYSFPTIYVFDNLVNAYGNGYRHTSDRIGYGETTGVLYKLLGGSNLTATGTGNQTGFLSSTEYDSTHAYYLNIYPSGSNSANAGSWTKFGSYMYSICYKSLN